MSFLASDLTLEDYVAAHVAEEMARWEKERNQARAEQARQRMAFNDAMRMTAVSCGVRPRQLDYFADATRAADLFELRDGQVVAKVGITSPRDPSVPYDVIVWMADLRERDLADAHPLGGIFWE